jgi:hypothetical protein
MSDKKTHPLTTGNDQQIWQKALSELDAEITSSVSLTEEEKRFLLEEMDSLSDDDWEPVACSGEPVSETIIKDRGER